MAQELLINLHTHLEGRVHPETAVELAAVSGLPDPEGGWAQALQLAGPALSQTAPATWAGRGRPLLGFIARLWPVIMQGCSRATPA
jgi:hypothetical protein